MKSSFLQLVIIPVLEDNYCYLIAWNSSAIVIDPGEAGPVIEKLANLQLNLEYILCTHHHYDHIGGNEALKKSTGCKVVGPGGSEIPGLDMEIGKGDLEIGPLNFEVFEVPGHTLDHIAFYLPENEMIFTGDSLFAAGSGRLFEGTAEMMISSLAILTGLPNDTQVYCGHEYTLKNLEFAHKIEPNYGPVTQRLNEVRALREQGRPTMPSTIGLEQKTNPFLRVNELPLQQSLGCKGKAAAEVFTELRRRRNAF